MKKPLCILLIQSALSITFNSCKEEKQIQDQFSSERVKSILDSIGESKVIACFYESGALSIIQIENTETRKASKIVYRMGYTVFRDSLVYVKPNAFKSVRLNTNYLIKDSTVISIQQAKIIHPSSNWQGQTPWQQPYVNIYKRLDI